MTLTTQLESGTDASRVWEIVPTAAGLKFFDKVAPTIPDRLRLHWERPTVVEDLAAFILEACQDRQLIVHEQQTLANVFATFVSEEWLKTSEVNDAIWDLAKRTARWMVKMEYIGITQIEGPPHVFQDGVLPYVTVQDLLYPAHKRIYITREHLSWGADDPDQAEGASTPSPLCSEQRKGPLLTIVDGDRIVHTSDLSTLSRAQLESAFLTLYYKGIEQRKNTGVLATIVIVLCITLLVTLL